jgi:hypothetical protein
VKENSFVTEVLGPLLIHFQRHGNEHCSAVSDLKRRSLNNLHTLYQLLKVYAKLL